MNRKNRVGNSSKNLVYGLGSQITMLVLQFVVRTVFVKCLNDEYLGVNGLFSNILSILSLAEMGFGTAMVYSMYKPLAENNKEKIAALMQLYKKVYTIVGTFIGIAGLLLIPFMDYIIKDQPDIEHLILIYVMYLANSVLSYLFFAYKQSILYADQRTHIQYKYHFLYGSLRSIAQILVLLIFRDFILYLATLILFTVIENIALSVKVDKLYPYLKEKSNEKLEKAETRKIKEDVKALCLHNIGKVSLNNTNNVIISSMVGVVWVGKLSNYTLITASVVMLLTQVATALTGSIGHYFATESKERHHTLFKRVDFLNFLLYGFSALALISLFNPFIALWLGESYILDQNIVTVIGLNFYIEGMLESLNTFRITMGLFVQGKYRQIVVAVLNIVISIILAQFWGVFGVLFGATIARLAVNIWYDPYIIFKYGLGQSVQAYYKRYILRFILLAGIAVPLLWTNQYIMEGDVTILSFSMQVFVTIILPFLLFLAVFWKTDEMQYLRCVVKGYIIKLKRFYFKIGT